MLNQPWKRHSPTKSPRKSPTKHNSPSRRANNNKIEHQIENDGCRCAICLRLAIENMYEDTNVGKLRRNKCQTTSFKKKSSLVSKK